MVAVSVFVTRQKLRLRIRFVAKQRERLPFRQKLVCNMPSTIVQHIKQVVYLVV